MEQAIDHLAALGVKPRVVHPCIFLTDCFFIRIKCTGLVAEDRQIDVSHQLGVAALRIILMQRGGDERVH